MWSDSNRSRTSTYQKMPSSTGSLFNELVPSDSLNPKPMLPSLSMAALAIHRFTPSLDATCLVGRASRHHASAGSRTSERLRRTCEKRVARSDVAGSRRSRSSPRPEAERAAKGRGPVRSYRRSSEADRRFRSESYCKGVLLRITPCPNEERKTYPLFQSTPIK